MKVICALENIIKEFEYPDNTLFMFNEPKQGWVRLKTPDNRESWFNLDHLIGIAPSDPIFEKVPY